MLLWIWLAHGCRGPCATPQQTMTHVCVFLRGSLRSLCLLVPLRQMSVFNQLHPPVYCTASSFVAQVADRLNSMGVPCNLVTGQETRSIKGARHTACTVEMADLSAAVDVSMRAVC